MLTLDRRKRFPKVSVAEITSVTLPAAGGTKEVTTITIPAVGQHEIQLFGMPAQAVVGVHEQYSFYMDVFATDSHSDIEFGGFWGYTFMGTFETSTGSYYWWLNSGSGEDPLASGTGIMVDTSFCSDASAVSSALASAIIGTATGCSVSWDSNLTVTVTNDSDGDVTDAYANGGSDGTFTATVITSGQTPTTYISAGTYFTLSSTTTNYYVWFKVDGAGADPAPGGTGIGPVNLTSNDSSFTVGAAVTAVLNAFSASSIFVAENFFGNVYAAPKLLGPCTDPGATTIPTLSITKVQDGTTSNLEPGDYFNINIVGTAYYVWFQYIYTAAMVFGTDPAPGGTGIRVQISDGNPTSDAVGRLTSALNNSGKFTATDNGTTTTATNVAAGAVTDASGGTITGVTISTTTQGVTPNISTGKYWTLSSPTVNYYVWYNVDSLGGDPAPGGKTAIQVSISGTSTANTIATATASAIDALAAFIATASTATVTVTNAVTGVATDAANFNMPTGFSITVTTQGS